MGKAWWKRGSGVWNVVLILVATGVHFDCMHIATN
jgi:hypothetical protein